MTAFNASVWGDCDSFKVRAAALCHALCCWVLAAVHAVEGDVRTAAASLLHQHPHNRTPHQHHTRRRMSSLQRRAPTAAALS